MKKVNYKNGLKDSIVGRESFEKELNICKQLSRENDGNCNWGKCSDCGVIPLLYKLYKGGLLEGREKIKEIKNNILRK